MGIIRAKFSAVIDAPPAEAYSVLSDYHNEHPAILPESFFTGLTVLEGGRGEGTVIQVGTKFMGSRRDYRLTVSEPEPGRVLVEAHEEEGVKTTFTVDPIDAGSRSRVTIDTELRASPGVRGLFERLFTPAIMRRMYRRELRQMADYMGQRAAR